MKTLALTTVALTTFAFSASVDARPSTDAELRGYNNCLAAAQEQSKGLVPTREYLINKDGANTLYYVNATRWENGERNTIRVACETAVRGHNLISASIEEGRFIDRDSRVTVEVAQN